MAVWTAVLGRLPSGIDCNSVGGRTDARRDTLPCEGVLGGGISSRLEKKEIQDLNVMCMYSKPSRGTRGVKSSIFTL